MDVLPIRSHLKTFISTRKTASVAVAPSGTGTEGRSQRARGKETEKERVREAICSYFLTQCSHQKQPFQIRRPIAECTNAADYSLRARDGDGEIRES
ncbi:hypothetical protein QQF64_003009 [Cirrhinus molitorella]|uniref:Uncharacterized protein n=1 Tax=Cirrhinus molitorella TaxID=172907 RepID=A0ABR3MIR7_9TELE